MFILAPNKTERGRAIVDIFRVEDGKIVEHWDVFRMFPRSRLIRIRCFEGSEPCVSLVTASAHTRCEEFQAFQQIFHEIDRYDSEFPTPAHDSRERERIQEAAL